MTPILIVCDDLPFREALRNFLLAAGYSDVEVVETVRKAVMELRCESYRRILVCLSRPLASQERLARVAQERQPGAKALLFISADDVPFIKDTSFVYVIKERAFSTLLQLLAPNG